MSELNNEEQSLNPGAQSGYSGGPLVEMEPETSSKGGEGGVSSGFKPYGITESSTEEEREDASRGLGSDEDFKDRKPGDNDMQLRNADLEQDDARPGVTKNF